MKFTITLYNQVNKVESVSKKINCLLILCENSSLITALVAAMTLFCTAHLFKTGLIKRTVSKYLHNKHYHHIHTNRSVQVKNTVVSLQVV